MSGHDDRDMDASFFEESFVPHDSTNCSKGSESDVSGHDQFDFTIHDQPCQMPETTAAAPAIDELEFDGTVANIPEFTDEDFSQYFMDLDVPEPNAVEKSISHGLLEQILPPNPITVSDPALQTLNESVSTRDSSVFTFSGISDSTSRNGRSSSQYPFTFVDEIGNCSDLNNGDRGLQSSAHSPTVELEEMSSKMNKTKELLGESYRVLNGANKGKVPRKCDRKNIKSVREAGGQCLRCIFLRTKCSPDCPCGACRTIKHGIYYDLDCVRSDFDMFNVFKKGYPQLETFLRPRPKSKKEQSARHDIDLCFDDMFVDFDEEINPALLRRLKSMTDFVKMDDLGAVGLFLQEISNYSQQRSAIHMFLVSSCLLIKQHYIKVLYPDMLPFLQACRAFSSTCLLNCLDRMLRDEGPKFLPRYLGLVPQKLLINALIQFREGTHSEADQNDSSSREAEGFLLAYLSQIAELFRRRGLIPTNVHTNCVRAFIPPPSLTEKGHHRYTEPSNSLICSSVQDHMQNIRTALPQSWWLSNEVPGTPILEELDFVELWLALLAVQSEGHAMLLFVRLFARKKFTIRSLLERLSNEWFKLFSHDQDQPIKLVEQFFRGCKTQQSNPTPASAADRAVEETASTIIVNGSNSFTTCSPNTINLLFSLLRCLLLILLHLLSVLDKGQVRSALDMLSQEQRYNLGASFMLQNNRYAKLDDILATLLSTPDNDLEKTKDWIIEEREMVRQSMSS